MFRKEIIDALKARFMGVSEKILGRIADKLANTVAKQEDVAAAVEGVTFQQVLDSYGDSRATEAQQTAISNYEKKHGLKDGKAIGGGGLEEDKKKPDEGGDEFPAWAKAIVESNKALTERLNSLETERTKASRKTEIDAIIGKLPEKLRKPYERMAYEGLSEDDFGKLKTEVEEEVKSISDEMGAKGAVFGRPIAAASGKVSESKEATDAETEAVLGKLNI